MNRSKTETFEPRIVGFLCNWCSGAGATLAGSMRKKYPANFRAIRFNCTGSIDPQYVLSAFREGADGVMILGCHPGDCHYKEGNYNAWKRYHLLKAMLDQFGIEEERLFLDWVSASEGARFVELVTEVTEKVRRLGPLCLGWPPRTSPAVERPGLEKR